MKLVLAFISLLTSIAAADGSFLNIAILQLPERYLADIPLANRAALLTELSRLPDDRRLDYAHGWLSYFNDNPYREVGATSRFWLKLLPRKGRSPLVFVHIPREGPDALTGVLEKVQGKWVEVTKDFLPDGIELKSQFAPRRASGLIQVAPFVKKERRDGKGHYWGTGPRVMDLEWDGRAFQKRRPASKELSYD